MLASVWVGSAWLNVILLQPLVGQLTRTSRNELFSRLNPSLTKFLNAVGGLTLLSGLLALWQHPMGASGLSQSAWGRAILFGAISTVAVLYLGFASVRPTLKALTKAMAEAAPDSEPTAGVRFLVARLRVTSYLVAGLLLLTMVVMVFANLAYAGVD